MDTVRVVIRRLSIYMASFLFFLAPTILRLYPALPYSAPLADGFEWAGDKITQGLSSLLLLICMLLACSLISAPYRWLIGAHVPTPTPAPAATPTPTPAQLEEGIVAPEDASPAALTTSSASATCGTLFLFVVSAAFIAWDLLFRVRARVLAPAHSALENTGAVLLYFLRGWEVVFAFAVFSLAVGWAWANCGSGSGEGAVRLADADSGAPTEVLFDSTQVEEELKTPLEKGQAEN
jgi:hypothetical protein